MSKTIKMSKDYLSNIESLKEVKKETKKVIENIYDGFMNEFNKNNYDYAIENLVNEYRYVPRGKCVSNGVYIRFIDVKDMERIQLHKGGFVLMDNGYTMTFKSEEKSYKLNRGHIILFVKIKENERLRLALI